MRRVTQTEEVFRPRMTKRRGLCKLVESIKNESIEIRLVESWTSPFDRPSIMADPRRIGKGQCFELHKCCHTKAWRRRLVANLILRFFFRSSRHDVRIWRAIGASYCARRLRSGTRQRIRCGIRPYRCALSSSGGFQTMQSKRFVHNKINIINNDTRNGRLDGLKIKKTRTCTRDVHVIYCSRFAVDTSLLTSCVRRQASSSDLRVGLPWLCTRPERGRR